MNIFKTLKNKIKIRFYGKRVYTPDVRRSPTIPTLRESTFSDGIANRARDTLLPSKLYDIITRGLMERPGKTFTIRNTLALLSHTYDNTRPSSEAATLLALGRAMNTFTDHNVRTFSVHIDDGKMFIQGIDYLRTTDIAAIIEVLVFELHRELHQEDALNLLVNVLSSAFPGIEIHCPPNFNTISSYRDQVTPSKTQTDTISINI